MLVLWQVEGLTSWLTGKEAQQAALEGHEDPAVHSSEVNSKLGEVRVLAFCLLAQPQLSGGSYFCCQ